MEAGVFSLFYDTINYRLQRYENGGNQCTERRRYYWLKGTDIEQKGVLKENMKFRLIPKLTAVILIMILCIGCAGSVGYAEGEDKGQSFESLDSPTDFISTDEKKEVIEKSGDLPESFDFGLWILTAMGSETGAMLLLYVLSTRSEPVGDFRR